MKKAVKDKFKFPSMQKKLRSTGKCVIVESTRSTVWGTGLHYTSPDALNPKAFIGQNMMGTMLMEIDEGLTPVA